MQLHTVALYQCVHALSLVAPHRVAAPTLVSGAMFLFDSPQVLPFPLNNEVGGIHRLDVQKRNYCVRAHYRPGDSKVLAEN